MRNNYICALDLGSSKIVCSLAKKRGNSIDELFLESVPSRGIKRGRIVDTQEVSQSIEKILKVMKAKSGINVRSLCLNIYGQEVSARHSRTVIPLAQKRNKIITPSDIRRVKEEARLLGSDLENEVIQTIPFSYSIDERDNIKDPLGLYGHKLGIDLFIISVKAGYLQSLNRILNRLGYEIKHLFLSGLATSNFILSNGPLRQGLCVFCDIGADLTELVIFENTIFQNIETLPIGGDDITQGIANVFKIPFQLAQDLKHSYGRIAESARMNQNKEVMVKKDGFYKVILQREIGEVITNKAKSMCSSIKDKLDNLTQKKTINKIFVGGRTILVDGFLELMETTLNIPIKMATNSPHSFLINQNFISSVPHFLNYATSLGILYEAIELSKATKATNLASKNLIFKIISRVKEIYQEYF